MIRAMDTYLWLDFLGVRLDSDKAGDRAFTINLITPDNGEKFVVELSNGTLTNLEGVLADDPDLTVVINRSDLEPVMMGAASLEDQIAAGKVALAGDAGIIDDLKSMLVQFDLGFEILPGTGAQDLTPDANDFAQPEPADTAGG
jgi:alkyl sulfatase BDS1-like metallo-beta-lactamase superfamily hydrolase